MKKRRSPLKELKAQQISGEITHDVNEENINHKLYLILILLINFLVYLPVLSNGFVNWDDDRYISDNPLIHSINLKEIFSTYVSSNYHPLTILILAIEYHFFELNATGYHAVNLSIHLLNVFLVFQLTHLLSNKKIPALVCAFLFGIHPMHVESVAWAAELKDLLYSLFFLVSLIFYIKYLKHFNSRFYWVAVIVFLLSLLSKAMAASLPVVLLIIDYYLGRTFNAKVFFEKIPFFLLAIGFGSLALFVQQSTGATDMMVFPLLDRLMFASFGFITYLQKLILPIHLSAYYPYPIKPGESLPFHFYLYFLGFLTLISGVFYSLRYSKLIFFGVAFFSITVFLVLQVLPVGGAIMADRYSYLPSIGIFYIAAEGFYFYWQKSSKIMAIVLLTAFSIFYSVQTYQRAQIWNSSTSLWNDVIQQFQTIPSAYNNRGLAFKNEKKYELALKDLDQVILLNDKHTEAYINRGNVHREMNKFQKAKSDYDKAISLSPNFYKAYYNRGVLYNMQNNYQEAMTDFSKSAQLKPDFAEAVYMKGIVFYSEKKYEEAIKNYNKAIQIKKNYPEAYFSRGVSQYYLGQLDLGCRDLNHAARLAYPVPEDVRKLICK